MSCVVADTESNGFVPDATKVWCIVGHDRDSEESKSFDPDHIKEGLAYLDQFDQIMGHNWIGHDEPLLKKLEGWEKRDGVEITDTMVLSRLSNPDRRRPYGYTGKGGPHSIECWGYRISRAKPHHEDWSVFSTAMLRRCDADVGIGKLTGHLISAEMSGHNWGESIEIEHNVLRIMTQQAAKGVYFNVDRATRLVVDLEQRVANIDAKLIPTLPVRYKQWGVTVSKPFLKTGSHSKMVLDWFGGDSQYVGGPFTRVDPIRLDLNSIAQIKEYWLKNGWKPTEYNFSKKTGMVTSPKITEDSYDSIQGDMAKQIKDRMLFSHRRGQIQGWLDRVRPDSRLSASANTCGTPTGRFRHSNVVNIPKAVCYPKGHPRAGELVWCDDPEYQYVRFGTEMRSLFTVPRGYRLVGCDAEQLELRLLAHFMGDLDYIREIINGDIHTLNQNLAGLPTRDDAKTFIYAFLYGAGDGKLGDIIGGSDKDGARLRKAFLSGLPKLGTLIRRVKSAATKGYLKGLDGRKLWLRQSENGEVMKHKALNLLIQGAGAVVMKKAMCIFDESIRANNYDLHEVKKVLDMHDEFQNEVREDLAEEIAELSVQAIVKAGEHFELRCPMAGQAKIGMHWAETH